MANILATGFTPFDGRDRNASWIAAQLLARDPEVTALEVPVVWGEPMRVLAPLMGPDAQGSPSIVISLGEGREGWFDIETRARNARNPRPDNHQALPAERLIVPAAPALLAASVDAGAVQRALAENGFPARISTDAGAFLCEEMLYTLETLKRIHATPQCVIFVHLPPWGTQVTLAGKPTRCDEALLSRFADALLAAIRALGAPH